ncbi:MAG: fumarylacetoacetate hydrolase family protein [Pseudomonadota bacterium]
MAEIDRLAGEVHAALTAPHQIPPLSETTPDFDSVAAYAVSRSVRALRAEPVVGRKIGFTNQTLWARYGVSGPMWGDMTPRTILRVSDAPVPLSPYCEPRLEPEVALKLRYVPDASSDDAALIDAIEWFAPAFEVVHSIYPGWQFALTDCIAANSLHGALLLGPAEPPGDWSQNLAQLSLELTRNGAHVETGRGENVMGGPLNALRYLLEGIAVSADKQLAAGDIITTGTLTDAWPLSPGERWTAQYIGTPLQSITASFS